MKSSFFSFLDKFNSTPALPTARQCNTSKEIQAWRGTAAAAAATTTAAAANRSSSLLPHAAATSDASGKNYENFSSYHFDPNLPFLFIFSL
jgi:hypothetical protein